MEYWEPDSYEKMMGQCGEEPEKVEEDTPEDFKTGEMCSPDCRDKQGTPCRNIEYCKELGEREALDGLGDIPPTGVSPQEAERIGKQFGKATLAPNEKREFVREFIPIADCDPDWDNRHHDGCEEKVDSWQRECKVCFTNLSQYGWNNYWNNYCPDHTDKCPTCGLEMRLEHNSITYTMGCYDEVGCGYWKRGAGIDEWQGEVREHTLKRLKARDVSAEEILEVLQAGEGNPMPDPTVKVYSGYKESEKARKAIAEHEALHQQYHKAFKSSTTCTTCSSSNSCAVLNEVHQGNSCLECKGKREVPRPLFNQMHMEPCPSCRGVKGS